MANFFRKLFFGTVEDTWREACDAQGRLDAEIAPLITEPDYHQEVKMGQVTLHICGPEAIKRLSPTGWMCWAGDGPGGVVDHAYVLGGPLPNGKLYASQHAFGHEAMAHFLGIDADHLCEGL
ncbi:MAG: hypothetical protein KQH53_08280 [Desulfarculaceae bacterium]|nr:hypothetical protein [Desulfarculaceae bacterium]